MSASAQTHRFPRLDKYELIDELGHGGMATVYRARDLRLEREVAVKVIHSHLRENPEVRGRFVAEAKAVAKLRHPGIVDVYDVSSDEEDERFLVVELIKGTTLRKLLDDHGALPVEIGAIITAQLCDAVQHAHDAGVIHRDIKPENVLIDRSKGSERSTSNRDGASSSDFHRVRVKLTDFGIAKVLDAQGVTSTGQILGSPAHMAPEQIEGGEIGPATDVFALGVLMYECVVGKLPFSGANPAQVLRRVLACAFEPADVERPQVGARWSAIVAKALSLHPEDRYASAEEFGRVIAEELDALHVDEPRRTLEAYFADPAAFAEQHEVSLVPRLLVRGEEARQRKDVQGAAADFNRALALRPDDLSIIKRLNAVTARRHRSLLLRRLSVLSIGATLLGGGAFGVARAVKSRGVEARELRVQPSSSVAVGSPVSSSILDAPSSTPVRETAAAPRQVSVSSTSADARPAATAPPSSLVMPSADVAARSPTGLVVSQAPRLRKVRLTAVPAGAKLRVDGKDVAWFGRILDLAPGGHDVEGYMADNNPCCVRSRLAINVTEAPPTAPDEVQSFSVALGLNDARVSLSGGPPNARVTCDNGMVFGAGTPGVAKMSDLQRRTSCTFLPGNKRQSILITAGTPTVVPWPSG